MHGGFYQDRWYPLRDTKCVFHGYAKDAAAARKMAQARAKRAFAASQDTEARMATPLRMSASETDGNPSMIIRSRWARTVTKAEAPSSRG